MRSSLPFFRLFPPPKFMLMPHAGLDISDDGMTCVAYSGFGGTRHISLSGREDLPQGLFSGGDIKNTAEFVERLKAFGKKYGLRDVKVSIPEEKGYLFQTDVPSTEQRVIEQNIEFKLEENVPLPASDAVFYFDLLPTSFTGGSLRASVSVVPRSYIEQYMSIIVSAGLQPVSFEIVPKALARAIVPIHSDKTCLVVHTMKRKTGIYIMSGNVIHFTFTSSWGTDSGGDGTRFPAGDELRKEIARIRSYWLSHGNGTNLDTVLLVGRGAELVEPILADIERGALTIQMSNVWGNAINIDRYLPPVPRDESLEYAVAAGLAFDTQRSL